MIGWRGSSVMMAPHGRNDPLRNLLLVIDATNQSQPIMTIETSEEYEAAIERLKALGENPADGPDQEEFFDISAAMLVYETSGAAMRGAQQ